MVEIEKAFDTDGLSIYDFFLKPGNAFSIPLYQREYSWDEDNIEQLKEDLNSGVNALVKNKVDNDKEIRFLGNIITVTFEGRPIISDNKSHPTKVLSIIDGQQRISTISLLACNLYYTINELLKKLKSHDSYGSFNEAAKNWLKKLKKIFAVELGRGRPSWKPIVVKAGTDKWTFDGKLEEHYKSDVTQYLARVIEFVEFDDNEFPNKPSLDTNVGVIVKAISKWLEEIKEAHSEEEIDFPPAWEIIKHVNSKDLWGYKREELEKIINQKETDDKNSAEFVACSLVQCFALAHYLLDRCCITNIRPTNHEWAFDMFQSLNATGTPLTAIETFKPIVVNTTLEELDKFEGTKNDKSFSNIEKLFEDVTNAGDKSKLTQRFITSCWLTINGEKISSRFSEQRRKLDDIYLKSGLKFEDQENLLEYLGNYSVFYKNYWLEYSAVNKNPIAIIKKHDESNLASVLFLILKDSNHKMAITTIAPFFHKYQINSSKKNRDELVKAIKYTASFYLLWRAARSNSGLDKKYRNFFSDNKWRDSYQINFTSDDLRKHFLDIFEEEGLDTKEKWLNKSKSYLRYQPGKKKICRSLLFVAYHRSIPDEGKPGFIKVGKKGSQEYLNLDQWLSEDLKTVEHVAPSTNNGDWDIELYEEDEYCDALGNLILMPNQLNISASNRNWKTKLFYYKHLGNQDPDKTKKIMEKAEKEGIELSEPTIEKLKKSNYTSHIKAVSSLGIEHDWDKEFVEDRTENILSICRDRLIGYLESE